MPLARGWRCHGGSAPCPFPSCSARRSATPGTGFHVGHETAAIWARAADSFSDFPAFLDHFLPDGRAPAAGEVFVNPDLADTLESIAQTVGESFYRGELAERMETTARLEGGALRRSDLAGHRPDWVEPLVQPYRGVALAEIPPNGQGLAAQIALAILSRLDAHREIPGSARWTHLQTEAMKIAIRAAFDHFADPDAMRLPPESLLEPGSIAAAAAGIAEIAAPLPPVALPTSQDTVYLTTADASGMMVSMIQSNYMGFGSGIVVPGTGIALQNRGAGFVLDPAHPNVVGPNKRPYHTIIPGFVTRDGSPAMSFGVMGGHMQHQGHVQMVTRVFDHGENPQAASDAPRWHVTPGFTVALENGYPLDIAQDLAERGHTVEVVADHRLFGGAQLVYRLPDGGYCAASDHRKEGAAMGF